MSWRHAAARTSAPLVAMRAPADRPPRGAGEPFEWRPAVAWYGVAALSLASMASYVERLLLTLLFDPIKHDLHLNDTEVSLLSGMAFVLFFVTAGLAFGRLADRRNRKRLILLGVILWSAATFCCGLARSFAQLFVGRTFVGVGEATLGPSAQSILADQFPRQHLPAAVSVYSAASYVGAGAALVVGGAVIRLAASFPAIAVLGAEPLHAWQIAFMLSGAGGLLVLIPLAFLHEPRRRGVAAANPTGDGVSLLAFLKTNRALLACHFGGFSLSAILGMGAVAWTPSFFIRTHHWTAAQIGFVYGAVLALVGGLAILMGGRIAAWFDRRGMRDVYLRMPAICLAAAAPFSIAVVLVPDANVAVACLAISTFIGSLCVACIGVALQLVTPNEVRGQVLALFAFVGNIVGPALGPTLIAALTDYLFRDPAKVGLAMALATLVITPIVTLLLWLGAAPFRASLDRAKAWGLLEDPVRQ